MYYHLAPWMFGKPKSMQLWTTGATTKPLPLDPVFAIASMILSCWKSNTYHCTWTILRCWTESAHPDGRYWSTPVTCTSGHQWVSVKRGTSADRITHRCHLSMGTIMHCGSSWSNSLVTCDRPKRFGFKIPTTSISALRSSTGMWRLRNAMSGMRSCVKSIPRLVMGEDKGSNEVI